MGRGDMSRDEREHRREQGRIVGKAEPGDDVGKEIEGQDEISDGREQHTSDAHRCGRVERAVIAGDNILDERNLASEAPQLRPEIGTCPLLPLGELAQRNLLAESRIAEIARIVKSHHGRILARHEEAKIPQSHKMGLAPSQESESWTSIGPFAPCQGAVLMRSSRPWSPASSLSASAISAARQWPKACSAGWPRKRG